MLKTIKGMYLNGQIKFSEIPQNVPIQSVIVPIETLGREETELEKPISASWNTPL